MKDKQLLSRDEMNLIEFPFALLSNRQPKNCSKTIEFSDTIRGPKNMAIKRKWTVTGSDKWGLPLSLDEDLFLAIIYMAYKQNFISPEVHFVHKHLLDLLKWDTSKQYYKRLEEGLARLKGVTIYAKNAFWDNATKSYTTVGFGIISDYTLKGNGRGRKRSNLSKEDMSVCRLDAYVFQSIKSGYIKSIHFNFWRELASSITKRLYRYLDKKFFRDNYFEINLFKLAFEKIGVSRNLRYRSSILQKLRPAIDELIHKDYLKAWDTRGDIMCFHRNGRFGCRERQQNHDFFANASLLQNLNALGIQQTQAYKMIGQNQPAIAKAVDIYFAEKHKRFETGKEAIKNPAAYVTKVYENEKNSAPSIGQVKSRHMLKRDMRAQRLWRDMFARLPEYLAHYEQKDMDWLSALEPVALKENQLVLQVANEMYKSFIEKTYLTEMQQVLHTLDNELQVTLVVD